MSENTETAILAGGCFWPAQELPRYRDGVISGHALTAKIVPHMFRIMIDHA